MTSNSWWLRLHRVPRSRPSSDVCPTGHKRPSTRPQRSQPRAQKSTCSRPRPTRHRCAPRSVPRQRPTKHRRSPHNHPHDVRARSGRVPGLLPSSSHVERGHARQITPCAGLAPSCRSERGHCQRSRSRADTARGRPGTSTLRCHAGAALSSTLRRPRPTYSGFRQARRLEAGQRPLCVHREEWPVR